jgi:hypothetical protein
VNAAQGDDASLDTEAEEGDDASGNENEGDGELASVWYAIPVWRLWLFSLLGGAVYQMYWMYRSWRAFRQSMGYSEQARWLARYERNGFRPSPFWRAALGVYSYCWLVVVRREARLSGVTSFGPPGLWFACQLSGLWLPLGWSLIGVSIAFVPAQLAVNRMHDSLGANQAREAVTAAELVWLALGFAWLLLAARGALP